jgi:integrase
MADSRRSGRVSKGQNMFPSAVGSARKSAGVCAFRHSAACVAVPSTGFGRSSLRKTRAKLTIASRAHGKEGSVKRARKPKAIRNEARGTWVCFPVINGKRTTRKLGNLNELSQQQADHKAEDMLRKLKRQTERNSPTILWVAEQYQIESLPKLRHSTQRVASLWLKKHILPKWGQQPISELQPRTVELWLESLPLAPKTRGHLRELLHRLVDYAMWRGAIAVAIKPISLVTVRGCSKRRKQPRNLTPAEFYTLSKHLREPFKTMALLQVCLGLRVSELLALRWQDVDWMGGRLNVEHGIVNQRLDAVKTEGSRKAMSLDSELLAVLSVWKQDSEFRDAGDWLFPSPVKLGRLPYSYTGYWRGLQEAAALAGIGVLGTHAFRHTYRSWLDAVGTAITVQQKLMRHSDIQTTLNIYGDVIFG